MAFRFFRKNKQFTKWFYIVITVIVMLTFSITGAMYQGLNEEHESYGGVMELPSGRTVEIPGYRFQQVAGWFNVFAGRGVESEDIWTYLMLDELAQDTGVEVSDEALSKALRQLFGVSSDQDLKAVARNTGLTTKEILDFTRGQLRTSLFQQLTMEPPRPLSSEVYEQFKQDNELFALSYARFADDAAAQGLDPASVSEEDLKRFYEEELSPARKRADFSTPERFRLDFALLDPSKATVDELTARLPEDQRVVPENDLRAFYERNKDRWVIEEAAEEETEGTEETEQTEETEEAEEAEEPAGEGAGEDEDAAADDAADAVQYRPFEEVREEILRQLIGGRLISAAANEYRKLSFERMKEEAAQEKDELQGEEPESAEPEPPKEDLLAKVAAQFGLEHVVVAEPVTIEGLATLDRIGSADLEPFVRGLPVDNIHHRGPGFENPHGFVLRMIERIEPEPLAFDEVKGRLPDAWREETARKRSREAADAFKAAVNAKARALAATEIAAQEAAARDRAQKSAAEQNLTDAAAIDALVAEELKAAEPVIEELAAGREGEVFEEAAREAGIELTAVPAFRKSYRNTRFYGDDPPSAEKFLKGHAAVFNAPVGTLIGPLRDDMSSAFVVVEVSERSFPPPESMRLIDRVRAEAMVRGMKGRDITPLDYNELARRLNLRLYAPETAAP